MAGAVKLFGTWASPYSTRVIWALKLKGIPFDYVEEDLTNKSPLLLQYNPVHKKVPVLVHEGRPVCESMIIIEYLDEKWPEHPLLPTDPHERAVARFWVKFAEDKLTNMWLMYRTAGEEQEKARKDTLEMLRVMEEEGLKDGRKFFGGDRIGIADIAFGVMVHWIGVVEEVSGGTKLFQDGEKFARVQAWMKSFRESPVVSRSSPDTEEMIPIYRQVREKLLSSYA